MNKADITSFEAHYLSKPTEIIKQVLRFPDGAVEERIAAPKLGFSDLTYRLSHTGLWVEFQVVQVETCPDTDSQVLILRDTGTHIDFDYQQNRWYVTDIFGHIQPWSNGVVEFANYSIELKPESCSHNRS